MTGREESTTTTRPEPHRHCPLCGQDNRRLSHSKYSRDGWLLKGCPQCDLLYLENPPPVESLADEYHWSASFVREKQRRMDRQPLAGRGRAWWKRWRRRWLPRHKLETLIQHYVTAGNLLDIGCGSGDKFRILPASIVPHGIEIDSSAIESARLHVEKRGGRIIHADALNGLKQMAAEEMQGIVMHSFLEHDIHPLEVLRESGRVLTGDGAIIVKVPNFACWNRRYWHGQEWPGFRYPDHVNYFTPVTLSQLVSKAGLRILQFAWRDRFPTSDNMWLVAGKDR